MESNTRRPEEQRRVSEKDARDWFSYQADRVLPKPREKPVERREPEPEPSIDITVVESPGQDGPETIIEKVNNFWNR
jgi:hypothetical protein